MNKAFGLFGLGILIAFLFVSLTSAIAFTDNVDNIELSPQENDTFILTSNENGTFSSSLTQFDLSDSDGNSVTVTLTQTRVNPLNVTYSARVTGDFSNFNFMESASNTVFFTVTNGTDSDTKSVQFTFLNNNFCENIANPGKLEIEVEDIQVINGFGDEHDYWYLLDEIEVEIDVLNEGSWDVADVEIYWELYTTDGVKVSEGDVDTFDLDEDDGETITFTFRIDEDIEEFDGEDAILYIRATGEIDDNNADEFDGVETCGYDSGTESEIRIEKDFTIATNFMVNNEDALDVNSLLCGETIEISADIWNIGSSDQDDILVNVISKELGIYETFEFSSIDSFDQETIQFEFAVPKNLQQKSYALAFEVYDEDNDLFENEEDDESLTYLTFRGQENCAITVPTLTATLEGEAEAGKQMVINSTIKNNDVKARVFTIAAEGHESWARLTRINPEVVQLGPGQTGDVTFTFMVDKDLPEGDYTFNIKSTVDSEEVLVQAIAVSVKENKFSFKGLFQDLGSNFDWKLWGIILLNVILLAAIIIVTVRILKRR